MKHDANVSSNAAAEQFQFFFIMHFVIIHHVRSHMSSTFYFMAHLILPYFFHLYLCIFFCVVLHILHCPLSGPDLNTFDNSLSNVYWD